MNAAPDILALLAADEPVAARVMIIVAHPDDETIGLGAQLHRFADALLVHVTDGAPRDGDDARAYGFARIADYATARRAELAAALREGGAEGLRRLALDIPDKQAWRDLAGLARRVAGLLRSERPAAIFTHAYEGGHPDHDAAAFAVHAACQLVAAPPIIEMPFYHRRDGRLVTGEFLPASARGVAIPLRPEDRERKRRMIDRFATQRWLLDQFDNAAERFRRAPAYDFRQPPHPGELHYETLGWGIGGADWRRTAAATWASLGLVPPRHREDG
jgi:LmbE family N-acetylglucosaminyl deacetylase